MSTTTETAALNLYGRMAVTWWETHQPAVWATISNPTGTARRISEQVMDDFSDRQAQLQANLPRPINDNDLFARASAIRHTQTQALELVIDDWFPADGGPGRLPSNP